MKPRSEIDRCSTGLLLAGVAWLCSAGCPQQKHQPVVPVIEDASELPSAREAELESTDPEGDDAAQ